MKPSGIKIVAKNKNALRKYSISDQIEAGLVLNGAEIKSVRFGKVSLSDSYAKFLGKELYLINMHIAPYKFDSAIKYDPRRSRKLLLKKSELNSLIGKLQKGFTLVPLKIYLKRGYAKVELGLGKGKKLYDRRQDIKEKDIRRQIQRDLKNS